MDENGDSSQITDFFKASSLANEECNMSSSCSRNVKHGVTEENGCLTLDLSLSIGSEIVEKRKNEAEEQRTVQSATPRRKNQLTIFFDGQVNVYNGVSEDAAKAVMIVAAASACKEGQNFLEPSNFLEPISGGTACTTDITSKEFNTVVNSAFTSTTSRDQNGPPDTAPAPSVATTPASNPPIEEPKNSLDSAQGIIPIRQARRASLQRFLVKRKHKGDEEQGQGQGPGLEPRPTDNNKGVDKGSTSDGPSNLLHHRQHQPPPCPQHRQPPPSPMQQVQPLPSPLSRRNSRPVPSPSPSSRPSSRDVVDLTGPKVVVDLTDDGSD